MQLDPNLVDLLLSRLLHDLIGPVTATVNGIELIEEYGDKDNDPIAGEALDLIGTSAQQTADRLSYFRVAFGGGGNTDEHSLGTIRKLAEAYLTSRKVSFEFSSDASDGERPTAGIPKMVLSTIFLMADALPRSGTISVEIDSKTEWTTAITARGLGAMIEKDSLAGLVGSNLGSPLNTRTVIGAMVAQTASRFGIRLELHAEADLARITLLPEGQVAPTS
jgi:histidine phosphotransferase ChpT